MFDLDMDQIRAELGMSRVGPRPVPEFLFLMVYMYNDLYGVMVWEENGFSPFEKN
jgi:hypothetical protein